MFYSRFADNIYPHSIPTRRSSDLVERLVERHADHVQRVDLGASLHVIRVDRKSTRLNSSHANISYAVFCLKKKKLIVISEEQDRIERVVFITVNFYSNERYYD